LGLALSAGIEPHWKIPNHALNRGRRWSGSQSEKIFGQTEKKQSRGGRQCNQKEEVTGKKRGKRSSNIIDSKGNTDKAKMHRKRGGGKRERGKKGRGGRGKERSRIKGDERKKRGNKSEPNQEQKSRGGHKKDIRGGLWMQNKTGQRNEVRGLGGKKGARGGG